MANQKEDCQKIIQALLDFIYDEIEFRKLIYGESFEIALAAKLKELENDQ